MVIETKLNQGCKLINVFKFEVYIYEIESLGLRVIQLSKFRVKIDFSLKCFND